MKTEILIKLIFVIFHISVTRLYLIFVRRKYGQQSSISGAAKNLKRDGLSVLVFLFIWLGMCSIIYVTQSYLMVISGSLIIVIGTVTGYNDNFEGKFQDSLHVGCATSSMALLIADVILKIINHFKQSHSWAAILLICAAGFVLSYTAYLLITKAKNRTWKIEDAFLWLLYFYAPFQYILIDMVLYKTQ